MNTRIAPSPTGKAHIGFVRTAYLNYLAARSTGGKFLLRIDDTDKLRSQDIYTQDLMLLFGANPNAPFSKFIYNVAIEFMAPFRYHN
jgi:hypothetical protein